MAQTHTLKILSRYFSRVADGTKNFEIRLNDRDFQAGDKVILQETQLFKSPTGNQATATIGFVTDYRQADNYVVFSLLDVVVDKRKNEA